MLKGLFHSSLRFQAQQSLRGIDKPAETCSGFCSRDVQRGRMAEDVTGILLGIWLLGFSVS